MFNIHFVHYSWVDILTDKKSLYNIRLKVLHESKQSEIEIKQEPLEIQGMSFQTIIVQSTKIS